MTNEQLQRAAEQYFNNRGGMFGMKDLETFYCAVNWALQNQWVSVEEMLPEEEAIFTNGLNVGIGHLTDDMDCDCDNGVLICGVTHWMEIPALPKGGEK